LMFIRYLLGHGVFEPAVVPYVAASGNPDLTLRVLSQGGRFVVQGPSGQYIAQDRPDYNHALFTLLASSVRREREPGMASILIETWAKWVADAIKRRKVDQGKEAFNQFQYSLLPFRYVTAKYVPS